MEPFAKATISEIKVPVAKLEIASVADEHYSFMGAADPVTMEKSARAVAAQMKAEGVNTVFLIPI